MTQQTTTPDIPEVVVCVRATLPEFVHQPGLLPHRIAPWLTPLAVGLTAQGPMGVHRWEQSSVTAAGHLAAAAAPLTHPELWPLISPALRAHSAVSIATVAQLGTAERLVVAAEQPTMESTPVRYQRASRGVAQALWRIHADDVLRAEVQRHSPAYSGGLAAFWEPRLTQITAGLTDAPLFAEQVSAQWMRREISRLASWSAACQSPSRLTAVHGVPDPEHCLIDAAGGVRLTDWSAARVCDPMHDVAVWLDAAELDYDALPLYGPVSHYDEDRLEVALCWLELARVLDPIRQYRKHLQHNDFAAAGRSADEHVHMLQRYIEAWG